MVVFVFYQLIQLKISSLDFPLLTILCSCVYECVCVCLAVVLLSITYEIYVEENEQ
jgi:hypothetical protein